MYNVVLGYVSPDSKYQYKYDKQTPDAVDVASGLNIAAFNVGIAIGAVVSGVVGGVVVENIHLIYAAWIGAAIVVLALLLTRWSGALDKRDTAQTTLQPA